MNRFLSLAICCILVYCFSSCAEQRLHTVSVGEFRAFVEETGYQTDAERYGWSIKQKSITAYDVLDSLSWMLPDGRQVAQDHYAVTQVSYNDALAYAEWSERTIPTYDQYWKLVSGDTRQINTSSAGILPIDQVNIVGNVWDITQPDDLGRVRLAGGSYLCDTNTCNGSSPDRTLYVDIETGNTHIGFSVIK